MSDVPRPAPSGAPSPPAWECPDCGGAVLPEGATEREGVRCAGCGARYRHPRMALLLALALPGLGSIHQRHYLWGAAALGFGSAAFLWAIWRLVSHVLRALHGDVPPPVGAVIRDGALGLGLVLLAYGADLAAVWWRRRRLVRR